MKLIFEKSIHGRNGVETPKSDVPTSIHIKDDLLRPQSARLPELSELDVIRHFTGLSRRNFGVDTNFYPLGSCTMKYNPKVAERIAAFAGFANIHPLLPQLRLGGMLTQGALQVLYETDLFLREVTGMASFTMQPMAGAHGELTGIMIMAAYHRDRGNKKTTILIPDSAHGTNPASAAIAGYKVVTVPTDKTTGDMDMDALRAAVNDEVAGLMLTCPNTLGLFNQKIKEVTDLIHSVDGLVYYDGANLNGIVGKARPGDFGFNIVHINLHKTFATPHGGGGPGAGPVGVCKKLVDYLPVSIVVKRSDGTFALEYDRPKSIGYIAPFYGNFGIILRAYVYMRMLGRLGLERVAENAVLNANYIREKLKAFYDLPFPQVCKHECVFSASRQMASGVHALDIAKALIDRGFHPPTIYFPLIVKEALMIEPTETESKETIDTFIDAMIEIAKLAESDPEKIKAAPITTPVGRLDETKAAKFPDIASL